MITLLSAVAMAAAAPVATQPTTPDHAGHNAPQTEQRGKGCCCCKDKAGNTQANEQRWSAARTSSAMRLRRSIRSTTIRNQPGGWRFAVRPDSSLFFGFLPDRKPQDIWI